MKRRRSDVPLPTLGISAGAYYSLSAAISIAFFFLVWGTLLDTSDSAPWIEAGIAACLLFAAFVIFRELLIRKRVRAIIRDRERLDQTLLMAVAATGSNRARKKISLDQNKAYLSHINTKSEAAKVLGKLPDAHREVFEICDQYLEDVDRQLEFAAPGSPRIAAFRTGSRWVQKVHRFHVLKWAELESRLIAPYSAPDTDISESIRSASRAAEVLETALSYYPENGDLRASALAIDELLLKAKIVDLTAKAEADEDPDRAAERYREALELIGAARSELAEEVAGIEQDLRSRLNKIDNEPDRPKR